jgi:hypothetical protein
MHTINASFVSASVILRNFPLPRHFKWNGFETPHDRKAIDAPRFAWHILARCKRKQQERAASPRKNVKITAWEFPLPLREGVRGWGCWPPGTSLKSWMHTINASFVSASVILRNFGSSSFQVEWL